MLALPSSCVFNNGQGRNSQNSRERRTTSTSLVTEDGAGFHNEGLDNVKVQDGIALFAAALSSRDKSRGV
jgi:hypothetical protein